MFTYPTLCATLSFCLITLCTIVSETAAIALDFHKYSIAFHMLQQIVSIHKLSASVFVRVNYTSVLP